MNIVVFLCAALGAVALFVREARRVEPHSVPIRQIDAQGEPFIAVEVDLDRVQIELFWKDVDGSRFGTLTAVEQMLAKRGTPLLLATNAGIFDPSFTPLGLHVENGREVVPLNLRDGNGNFFMKPNGVFYLDEAGAHIEESRTFSQHASKPRLAVQSGPLLLWQGKIHADFRPESQNRFIRNAVGVVSPAKAVFVLSNEPVNFYRLASFMRDRLHCTDGLYLDGNISQMLYPAAKISPPIPNQFAGILAVTERR